MAITVDLPLNAEEKAQLAGILRCDPDALDAVLAPYAAAALEEYARMFIGQRVFTRGSDIHEYRLFLLIKQPLEGRIPDEQQVFRPISNDGYAKPVAYPVGSGEVPV